MNLPIVNPHMLKEATCQKDAGIKARGLAEEKHKAAAGLSMLSLYRDKARPLMLMMLDWLGGLSPRREKRTAADAHDAQLVRGLWPGWEKRTTADAHDARLVGGSLAWMGDTHSR